MKIVIVDDSPTIRMGLRKSIDPLGYEVVAAEDGLDGIEKIKSNLPVDLVITDVNMPRMDGLNMSRELKSMPETKDIPILVLTTEGSVKMKQEGKEIGVMGWIVKPFQAEIIRKAVEAVIEKSKKAG